MKPAQRGFATPPEVTRYFDDKGLKPAFSWLDVWGEEHAYAFTVAKAVDAELLGLFRSSIASAIAKGQGFEAWRAALLPELQRIGWLGPREVRDPGGRWAPKTVDFSAASRLETIFWSNVRSALAAGQWERIQRTKAGLPYLVYVRSASRNPREQHLAFAGVVLPVDHVFWATHFPPNGWRCKCAVRQITRGQYERLAGRDGYSLDPPTIETRPVVNRRTGEITHVPVGIDPGWHTNPGLSRARTLVESVKRKLEDVGEAAARARIADIVDSPAPKILLGLKGDERLDLPVAVAARMAREWGARSYLVTVSNETMRRKIDKHAEVEIETFGVAQKIIDDGEVIDEGRGEHRRSIVAQVDGVWWWVVLAKSRRGFMRISSLHRTSIVEVMRLRRRNKRV